MTEKNLLEKLNNCKNVNPDANWLKNNRELFLAQISNSGANKLSAWESFYINLKCFAKASSQPVFALGIFFIVLVFSSAFSHRIFSQAKPNDSLYIARIISEKAKLNTVLDSKERDKMAVKFATGHARDITTVLANPEFNNEANQDEVAKLSESFNKEIETAKNKIVKINEREAARISAPVPSNENTSSTSLENLEDIVSIATENEYIDDNGLEISEIEIATTSSSSEELNIDSASSTLQTASSTETEIISKKPSDQIIDEAKELFEKKDYENVINKLNEINESIK